MQTWEKIKHDPSLLEKYLIREKVVDIIRSFFKKHSFREVQTPIMVPTPSCEPNLEVFKTKLVTFKGVTRDAYLIMSPEYSIKKLLSSGIGNCFEITKCFRNNEEVSSYHNPEFCMLEWYRTNADYMDVADDFERLFIKIIKTITPKVDLSKWKYQNVAYDITTPWPKISVEEAFEKYAEINADVLLSEKEMLNCAKSKGYNISTKTTWEEAFNQILFNEIEPCLRKLNRPYFLYDYPLSQAWLARKKARDPRFAERFEVFLAGVELGNCFSELLDAKEQEDRLTESHKERGLTGKSVYPIDKQLLRALELGLPEVAGIAVGVDRIIMLAGDFKSVSETMFFPAKEQFDLTEN